MSEPKQPEEIDAADTEETEPGEAKPVMPIRAANNPLSKATDFVARPGFRNPANTRTKAQKRKKRR